MKLKKFVSLLILVATVFTLMPVVNASAATTKKVDFPTAYCTILSGYNMNGIVDACNHIEDKKTATVISEGWYESVMELRVKKNQTGYYRIGTRGKFKSFKGKVHFTLFGNKTIFAYAKENGIKSQVRKIKYMQCQAWQDYLDRDEMCLSGPIDFALNFNEKSKVYYTLDGTKPTTKSKTLQNEEELPIKQDCVLRVLMKRKGFKDMNLYYQFFIDPKNNNLARKAKIINYSGVYNKDVSIRGGLYTEGKLYCTFDGSKPTTKSRKVPIGYCDDEIFIKETTTVNYLWINKAGKKQYFSQTYVIIPGIDNSSTLNQWHAGSY